MSALLIHADSYRDADLLYTSGFLAPDPFTYLERDGEAVLLTSKLESGRARKESRARVVRDVEEFGMAELLRERSDDEAKAEVVRRLLGEYGVREVRVPHTFPLLVADRLRGAGIALALASELPERRRRKSEREVRAIEAAQRATEAAFDLAVGMLRAAEVARDGTLLLQGQPLTAERLRAAIEIALLERGCVTENTIVAPGMQASDPHRLGSGPYRQHEAIVMDIYPRSKETRYFADMSRTVVRGEPPAAIARMYEAVRRAQEEGIASLRPGVTGREIHERVEDVLYESGYGTLREGHRRDGVASFIHGTGHGVGLELHEAPSVGRAGSAPLQPGDVVTIEPGLYDPGLGGVRLEDLLVVTETGARNLTRAAKTLQIA